MLRRKIKHKRKIGIVCGESIERRGCNFRQFSEKALSQDLKESREQPCGNWGKVFQTEGTASRRAPGHLQCGEFGEQHGGQSG